MFAELTEKFLVCSVAFDLQPKAPGGWLGLGKAASKNLGPLLFMEMKNDTDLQPLVYCNT